MNPEILRISFLRCNHSAFIHMLVCVVFTLVVQVVLTIRFVMSPSLDLSNTNETLMGIALESMQLR